MISISSNCGAQEAIFKWMEPLGAELKSKLQVLLLLVTKRSETWNPNLSCISMSKGIFLLSRVWLHYKSLPFFPLQTPPWADPRPRPTWRRWSARAPSARRPSWQSGSRPEAGPAAEEATAPASSSVWTSKARFFLSWQSSWSSVR